MTGQSAPQRQTFALECSTLAVHLLQSASRLAVKASLQHIELTDKSKSSAKYRHTFAVMSLADVDSCLELRTDLMGRCVIGEADTKLPMSPFPCTTRDKRTLDARDMPGNQLEQNMSEFAM